jgi:CDP-diacylglycerol--serine O-phosphatidyltransferase
MIMSQDSDQNPHAAPAARHPQMIALHKIIPNMLTMMALIAGITSIQKAINGQFDTAVLMLLAAAILDTLDGAAARALKSSSEFGAQLDSLSDFLAFGVAPSLILYEWVLDDAGKLGWIATIVLPVAAALRLARFNVMAKTADELPAWKKAYFSGVPSPAGAGLALLPIYIWFLLSPGTLDVFSFATPLIAIWTMVVAALMVSRIPTFSFKKLRVPARGTIPVMALLGLLIAAMIHVPFVMLTLISIIYLVTMPLVFSQYRRKEKEYQNPPEDLSSLAFGIPPFDPLADQDESSDTDKPVL